MIRKHLFASIIDGVHNIQADAVDASVTPFVLFTSIDINGQWRVQTGQRGGAEASRSEALQP